MAEIKNFIPHGNEQIKLFPDPARDYMGHMVAEGMEEFDG